MTEMFSQYDQRQQAQSAPGCLMTHFAKTKLCHLRHKLFSFKWAYRKSELVHTSIIMHAFSLS